MSIIKNLDSIRCNGRTGPKRALLCSGCEGKCPICGAPSDPKSGEPAFLCGECSFGELRDKCVICANNAKHKAFYCRECCLLGKDRDGCPRVINIGINTSDKFYERKKVNIPDEI